MNSSIKSSVIPKNAATTSKQSARVSSAVDTPTAYSPIEHNAVQSSINLEREIAKGVSIGGLIDAIEDGSIESLLHSIGVKPLPSLIRDKKGKIKEFRPHTVPMATEKQELKIKQLLAREIDKLTEDELLIMNKNIFNKQEKLKMLDHRLLEKYKSSDIAAFKYEEEAIITLQALTYCERELENTIL